jgi:hypothetical protein
MKRNVIAILFSILLTIGIAGTFWGPGIAKAASSIWDSCPNGRVSCAYPGDCRSYIDTNHDMICDRSQPAPQSSTSSTSFSGSALADSASSSASIAAAAPTVSNSQNIKVGTDTGEIGTAAGAGNRYTYYFVPILAVLIVLYAITWLLSARKTIGILLHRKIWNVVLLVSSMVSALLGIVLLINIEFGTGITLPFNMLFWHVEAGIALSIVAIFHIIWHWRYFAKIMGMTKAN